MSAFSTSSQKHTADATTVWIVDDDDSLRWVLEKTFLHAGMNAVAFEDAYHALEGIDRLKASENIAPPDVILSDIRMPGMDGLAFLTKVHEWNADIPVIIMTAHSDLDSAVSSYKTGAFEYLPKPFDIDDAVALVERAKKHKAEQETADHATLSSEEKNVNARASTEVKRQSDTPQGTHIIGESPAMQEVFRAIGRLAQSNITVLINGESGTGKELIAKALHEHSPRADAPFIALNMAAIPSELIEAELFGHDKGAFTGATSLRKGRFEQAHGGTLFLDEIGDMPLATQTRLLRVLADGEFYRVGGHTSVKVDVRIIAATHQNLENRVAKGEFREDLFYRLNVIRMKLPALRDRPEDVPMLAAHFLEKSAVELGVESKLLKSDALHIMQMNPWRGNVRQLENLCRWLTVMVTSREVSAGDLPENILNQSTTQELSTHQPVATMESTRQTSHSPTHNPQNETLTHTPELNTTVSWDNLLQQWITSELHAGNNNILASVMPVFEKTLIETALKHTRGRKGEAAKLLGWGRNTLTRKLHELDLH